LLTFVPSKKLINQIIMKKIYLFLAGALMLSTLNVDAQSQRKVLIEKGSNASCAPCAAQNPGFHTMLNTVDDKYVGISYQWYFPGYDPMHEHNPTEANARFQSYYGQNGVPTAMIDGTVPANGSYPGFNGSYAGSPAGFSATMINNRYAVASPFDIDIDYTITPTTITATVTVTCTQAITNMSQLKLRTLAVERVINFAQAPGTNGETVFYNVMKKFLGGTAGVTLNSNWTVGQSQEFTASWAHQNVYNFNQLSVVAFIQNDANKEVLQAGRADGAEFTSTASNAATILNIVAPADLCAGTNTISPVVRIRNTGNSNLTSCELFATVNGVEVTSTWNGNLPLMSEANFTLNPITFNATAGANELTVECQNTNNATNEEALNSASVDIATGAEVSGVKVTIVTDNYGSETYWRIINASGTMVAQGGNQAVGASGNTGGTAPNGAGMYSNATTYNVDVPLPADGCYTFEIYDYYGDGICCAYGNGSYTVRNLATNAIVLSGGEFTITDDGKFTQTATAIDENVLSQSFTFFPNPVVNEAMIQLTLSESAPVVIELFDLVGKLVYSENLGTQPAGEFVNRMNFSNMTNGMYMLNITAGGQKVTRKVTVSK
jgi:hypothetical protein